MQYRIIQVFCGFSHALAMFCKWCPLFLFPLVVIDSPENLGLAFVLWNRSSGFSSWCLFQVLFIYFLFSVLFILILFNFFYIKNMTLFRRTKNKK